jgi:hypothetical protein
MTEGPSRREVERAREALERHDAELTEPNEEEAEKDGEASDEQEDDG